MEKYVQVKKQIHQQLKKNKELVEKDNLILKSGRQSILAEQFQSIKHQINQRKRKQEIQNEYLASQFIQEGQKIGKILKMSKDEYIITLIGQWEKEKESNNYIWWEDKYMKVSNLELIVQLIQVDQQQAQISLENYIKFIDAWKKALKQAWLKNKISQQQNKNNSQLQQKYQRKNHKNHLQTILSVTEEEENLDFSQQLSPPKLTVIIPIQENELEENQSSFPNLPNINSDESLKINSVNTMNTMNSFEQFQNCDVSDSDDEDYQNQDQENNKNNNQRQSVKIQIPQFMQVGKLLKH